MATIYSNRNDNTGTHTTVDPNTGTTWVGNSVPLTSDDVYIVGRRTTINQSSFAKWAGTRTITVASTTNFADSGFFYTCTDQGELVKINYTGKTATTFTGCSVDETDAFYAWNGSTTASSIFNGAYVHNPAYIIEIADGETFECNELIIQEGGWLHIAGGGTLKVNQGIIVRDGRLIGRDNGEIIISRPAGTTGSSTVGYLNSENFYMSIIDIDGGENRTYSTLTANVEIGSGTLTVNTATNGSFAVGDEIAVYGYDNYRRRNVGYTGYRDATANYSTNMDEGLDVVGVSGNTLYVGLRNGPVGEIIDVTTEGAQKVIEVKPESLYFNSGDKIVVNNQIYTIDSITEDEHTLYDYDFTDPSTSLSDFWVNDTTHAYSAGWEIESGVGLRCTSGAYREFVHKYFWSREMIVEADMSPLSGYTSGTRGNAAFGLMLHYDPSTRPGHRGYESFKTDYLTIDDGNQDFLYYIRSMSNYNNNRQDRSSAVLAATRTAASYKVISKKNLTTVLFNGEEFTTEFRRDGHFKGLVGIYVNNNTSFRCRRLTIKIPTQKLYVTTQNSISSTGKVYATGTEKIHYSGERVVKISSTNTGDGSHRDLAFAFRGQRGDGIWPIIIERNGATSTNSSLPYIHNHDTNPDYFYDAGSTTSQVSVTFDLIEETQFTHVSFLPRTNDVTAYYGYNNVAIYGSNNLTNWTTLYGPTSDTKKWAGNISFNRMAFYPTGTVSYRYVKFETRGDQSGSNRNRYVNIGVHDFSEGYTLALNNASDFGIGDQITILSDSGFSWGSRELEAYQARIVANTNPEEYFHSGWETTCTITNKDGNKIFLDKPIFWGYVENQDSVTIVKTNKNFKISGVIGNNNTFADSWRWPNMLLNAGTLQCRKYLFRHVWFNYFGSQRYSGSTSYNRGINARNQDYWNSTVFDGCVHNFGPDGSTRQGVGSQDGIAIFRNSVVMNQFSGYFCQAGPSFSGTSYFNNKMLGCQYGIFWDNGRAFSCNYNEIATCDYGIWASTTRLDRNVIPFFREMRRNYIKGSSNSGIYINSETVGPRRAPRFVIKANKIRAMDDTAVSGQTFDGWPYEDSNFMAEHTGARLSRYRNEGFFSTGDTSSDISVSFRQINYGRFNYDVMAGVFHWFYKDNSAPNVTRVFNPNGDDFLAMLGIEFEVINSVAFEVVVGFEWRIPLMAILQDDGNMDGALRTYSIQHGTILTNNYTATPNTITPNVWNKQEYTFNNFTNTVGPVAVYLARDAQNGYVDLRNGHAQIRTDNPESIKLIGNTFNMLNLWDQHISYRDTVKPFGENPRAINIRKLKF